MDATSVSLPDDLDTLRLLVRRQAAQLTEQQATIAQLEHQNASLSHKVHLLLGKRYGRSSEKIDASQLLLFGQQTAQAASQTEGEVPATSRSRKRRGGGRRPLPDDLPRERIEHPIDPVELTCPCCEGRRVEIGEDVTEQLDFEPASLFVLQHVRKKFACPKCEDGGVARAPKPERGQVIDKGLPGPGLVAHIITSKYADHQPLYRLEGILKRHGVAIARSTMCGWMKAAADLLAPLAKVMAEQVRGSKVIHTDDTPVPVQAPGRGETKKGRLWVYLGDPRHPYTVYDYTPTRSRDGPRSWLKNFRGYLQADAFSGYDAIYVDGEVTEVACWAHARRKFYDARFADSERAHRALAMIRLLYDVEELAGEQELDATRRCALRQARSRPVLDELRRWFEAEQAAVLPKSPMGEAIGYALNQWEALTRYTTDGDLAIDNNAAERAIRPLVVGRKNYLFFGSDLGGRTAAVLYTVTASAKRHGIDPFYYLREVLALIGSTPLSQVQQFLPDRWRDRELEEIAKG